MYKVLVRPHLGYGDIIYDEAYNKAFHQKLESVQCNACLALSGAIGGSSREKLYYELLGIPPILTLAQETLLIYIFIPFQSNTNKKFGL